MYTVGIDLGQSQDYTAVTVIERHGGDLPRHRKEHPVYHTRHAERLPLGTSYPAVVEHVKMLLRNPSLQADEVRLVVDATGCGRPVLDMMRAALPRQTIAGVWIHGGDAIAEEGWNYRVPKRDLVAVLQVLLQDKRLKIAASLSHADLLTSEL